MKEDIPLVIAGAGSIGERHIGILLGLGYRNLWVYRQRGLPLRNVPESGIKILTDLHELETIRPAAAIICTPTAHHPELALHCAARGIHLLIEKPLAHTTEHLDTLRQLTIRNQVTVQVAYMLRYHPFFRAIRQLAESQAHGRLLSMQSYWGEYLPHWHPWEDYRQSYAARSSLGGGAALTLSHDVDMLNWLAQSPVGTWHTRKNYSGLPGLDVESGADISITYHSGLTAHSHVNFHEQAPRRWYRFVFEEASAEIDYFANTLTIARAGRTPETEHLPGFDRNTMFESQLRHFLSRIGRPEELAASLRYLDESETIIRICS